MRVPKGWRWDVCMYLQSSYHPCELSCPSGLFLVEIVKSVGGKLGN